MGLHKLEIEVTDELLSRIDSVSEATSNSRADVIVEALTDYLAHKAEKEASLEFRPDRLRDLLRQASRHSSLLSQEEVQREIREARGDE